jgi:proprotein convertase subtilisin/kexin type 5
VCSSASVCSQCDVLANYELRNGSCEAAPGYYLDATSQPVVCSLVGCYRCQSASTCFECSTPNNYVATPNQTCECDAPSLFTQYPSAEACVCQPGYFISSNNSCQAVPLCPNNGSGCLTCALASPASCSLCDAGSNFQQDPSDPALCTCQDGFFFDGLQCLPCNLTLSAACLSCASETLCLSCPDNFTLANGDCQCLPEYYLADSLTCLLCAHGCLRCSSATSCSLCDEALNFTMVDFGCECQPGMFLNSSECEVCGTMAGCLTCSTGGCTSCDPTFGFSLNASVGECQCDYGYFSNANDVCEQCSSLGCLACHSQTQCLECSF